MILYCILIAILYRHLLLFSLNLKYFCYYQFSLFCICKVCPTCAHSLAFCGVNSDLFLPKFFVFSVCIYIFVFIFFYFLLVFIFCNCNASRTCARFVACWGGEKATLSASNCFVASTLECDYILPWRVGGSNYILGNPIILPYATMSNFLSHWLDLYLHGMMRIVRKNKKTKRNTSIQGKWEYLERAKLSFAL